jgi:hypothetical protein
VFRPGRISRFAAALFFNLSVAITRGAYCKPFSSFQEDRLAALGTRRRGSAWPSFIFRLRLGACFNHTPAREDQVGPVDDEAGAENRGSAPCLSASRVRDRKHGFGTLLARQSHSRCPCRCCTSMVALHFQTAMLTATRRAAWLTRMSPTCAGPGKDGRGICHDRRPGQKRDVDDGGVYCKVQHKSTITAVPEKSGSKREQICDEGGLSLHVASTDVPNLPLPDHRHHLVAR